MDLDAIAGTYREEGVWKDSAGESGPLAGEMSIQHVEGRLEFEYDDSFRQVSAPIGAQDGPIELKGTLGDGNLYLGDSTLTLEYEADIDGRIEYNTDTWVEVEGGFRRAGVIRQAGRHIWFEAVMHRADQGTSS